MQYLTSILVLTLAFAGTSASAQTAPAAAAGGAEQLLGNVGQYLPLLFLLLGLAFWLGRIFAKLFPDDQRKIAVGAVLAIFGAALIIYGITSINSTSSHIASSMGKPDDVGILCILTGVFLGVIGFVTLASRAQSSINSQTPTTKKCPFCAETIQAEAVLCRFCGKTIENASIPGIAPSSVSRQSATAGTMHSPAAAIVEARTLAANGSGVAAISRMLQESWSFSQADADTVARAILMGNA